MRISVFACSTLASLGLMYSIVSAQAADSSMQRCHKVATQCRDSGADDAHCRRQVDACMSDHACEEVYLSCLELMELEENLSEEACMSKKASCEKRYMRQ